MVIIGVTELVTVNLKISLSRKPSLVDFENCPQTGTPDSMVPNLGELTLLPLMSHPSFT